VYGGGGGKAHPEFRMHIRYEFISLGLLKLLDDISGLENEFLQTQIDVFLNGLETEEDELFAQLSVRASREEFDALAKSLVSSVRKTSCEPSLHSILRHFAFLPRNQSIR
jgi:dishevelled associated activator of morphogenesis